MDETEYRAAVAVANNLYVKYFKLSHEELLSRLIAAELLLKEELSVPLKEKRNSYPLLRIAQGVVKAYENPENKFSLWEKLCYWRDVCFAKSPADFCCPRSELLSKQPTEGVPIWVRCGRSNPRLGFLEKAKLLGRILLD